LKEKKKLSKNPSPHRLKGPRVFYKQLKNNMLANTNLNTISGEAKNKMLASIILDVHP
jgi:hypothetical protein